MPKSPVLNYAENVFSDVEGGRRLHAEFKANTLVATLACFTINLQDRLSSKQDF